MDKVSLTALGWQPRTTPAARTPCTAVTNTRCDKP